MDTGLKGKTVLITGASRNLVLPLVESLRHEMLVRDERLMQLVGTGDQPLLAALSRAVAGTRPMLRQATSARKASLRGATEVRSIQRLPLPEGWTAAQVAKAYFDWLPHGIGPWIRVHRLDHDNWAFRLRGVPIDVLRLRDGGARSFEDRALFWVTGGALVAHSRLMVCLPSSRESSITQVFSLTSVTMKKMSTVPEMCPVAPGNTPCAMPTSRVRYRVGVTPGTSPCGLRSLSAMARVFRWLRLGVRSSCDGPSVIPNFDGETALSAALSATPVTCTARRRGEAKGVTGEVLLQMLERRIDNVVFRLGFAPSRSAARQLVRHRHFSVNGRTVDIPSFQLKPGDEIQVREKSKDLVVIKNSLDARKGQGAPDWVDLNVDKLAGRVLHVPSRASIPVPINEQLIVELYSK